MANHLGLETLRSKLKRQRLVLQSNLRIYRPWHAKRSGTRQVLGFDSNQKSSTTLTGSFGAVSTMSSKLTHHIMASQMSTGTQNETHKTQNQKL